MMIEVFQRVRSGSRHSSNTLEESAVFAAEVLLIPVYPWAASPDRIGEVRTQNSTPMETTRCRPVRNRGVRD
jgi:hypothetical protein